MKDTSLHSGLSKDGDIIAAIACLLVVRARVFMSSVSRETFSLKSISNVKFARCSFGFCLGFIR